MCDPISMAVASATVSTASSVLGFVGQNQAARANTRSANLSYANTSNQIGQKETQIDQQQSENSVQAMIDRAASQGRISASAGSMGSDAATTARSANAADFGAGRALGIENINSENQRVGIGNEIDNAFYARQTQENQILPQSPIQLALGVANAGLGGASMYAKLGGQFPGANTPLGGA